MSIKQTYPRRGDIYLINFDPTVGHEIKKTRPALIIQNDIANRYSSITIVAAITSKINPSPYPTEVPILSNDSGLPLDSAVLLNQLRSVDHQRLIKRIGRVNSEIMRQVDQAIQISLGCYELNNSF